jgi:WD40 repeat protein
VAEGVGVCLMRCTDSSTLALLVEPTMARVHDGDVYSVGFSPDGTKIVSYSQDRRVRILGGRLLLTQCSCVLAVAAGVRWAVCDGLGVCAVVRCADATTLAEVADLRQTVGRPTTHTDYVYSVGFSPDGTRGSCRALATKA